MNEFKLRVDRLLDIMQDDDPRLKAFSFNADDKTLKSSSERLSLLLHDVDPLWLGSNINVDMEDEYDSEALHIVLLSSLGVPWRKSFRQVFGFWFWEGFLEGKWNETTLDELIDWMQCRLDEPASEDMLTLHRDLSTWVLPQVAKGWSYAALMRTAPEQLDPKARPIERVHEDYPNLYPDLVSTGRVPNVGEPDLDEALPWLHHSLFEKTRRRTPPERQMSYARFRELCLSSLTEQDEEMFLVRFQWEIYWEN